METSNNLKYYNELDDEGSFDWPCNYRKHPQKKEAERLPIAVQQFVQTQDDSSRSFNLTYKAARFEESWLLDSLGYFYEQKWISDVLRKIKTGKEASVYLCRSGDQVNAPFVAAKIYRPRRLRNLRDDHIYREGRIDLDDEGHELHDEKSIHAIVTRSHYGEQVRHRSWIAYEYTALQALATAGVDVPRPYEMAHNAILMEYLGDEFVPAPTLSEVDLEPDETLPLFTRLRHNLDRMLAAGRIHGDLSAYNVLYWKDKIALIDFPQVISPVQNRNAYAIFQRDVNRLCEYFIKQGLTLDQRRIASDLWTSRGYRVRSDIHPVLLDDDDPADRRLWKMSE